MEVNPRQNLNQLAESLGFNFHTVNGDVYWDESRFYQFTLNQIEQGLEDPTNELHRMCLDLVDEVVNSKELMNKLEIPEHLHDWVAESWHRKDPSLYGRMDFAYDGKGAAKFLEYNGQTPTSLYEAAHFSWLWLADMVEAGKLPRSADQFNKLEEEFIHRFHAIKDRMKGSGEIYFACCKESDEDKATVDYMRDCAHQAGVRTNFIYVEDVGIGMRDGRPVLTDLEDYVIDNVFFLYPFEMMFWDEVGKYLHLLDVQFFEPPWKCILSHKGILPLLWERHKGHPNLLPAYFEGEEGDDLGEHYVVKPFFSREGENIDIVNGGQVTLAVDGMYGEVTKIKQKFHALAKFGDDFTLIGSWVIGEQSFGLTIREDDSLITKDTSRFVPHVIVGY